MLLPLPAAETYIVLPCQVPLTMSDSIALIHFATKSGRKGKNIYLKYNTTMKINIADSGDFYLGEHPEILNTEIHGSGELINK